MSAMGPWRIVRAGVLDIAVHESGPLDGPRSHRRVLKAGHNLPQEAPGVFADAVTALVAQARHRE